MAIRVSLGTAGIRRRVLLVGGFVLAVGSPWVQDRIAAVGQQSPGGVLLTDLLGFPQWRVTTADGLGWAAVAANDLCVAVLLAGLAVFAPRLVRRGPGGWAGLATILGVSMLITLVAALAGWSAAQASAQLQSGMGALAAFVTQAMWFSVLLGAVLAVLVGMTASSAPARAGMRGSLGGTRGLRVDLQRAHAPVGSVPGDVTRYLCAAAYTDEAFAGRVVDEVLADELSAVAPSVDVDLVAIARHALAARELRRRRDRKLAVAAVGAALVGPLWLLLGLLALGLVASTAARGERRAGARGESREVTAGSLVRGAIVLAAAIVLLVLIALDLAGASLPGPVRWFTGSYLACVPALLALIAAALVSYRVVVRHVFDTDRLLRTTMRRPVFSPREPPPAPAKQWLADRLSAIEQAQHGNVTVYSGYAPFVGFAATRTNWSLAIALLPPDQPGAVTAFTVVELVDHLKKALREIAARDGAAPPADGGTGLDTLTVEERVFVEGTSIAGDDRFIGSSRLSPSTLLTPEELRHIALHPTGTVRHYLAVHVPLWGGDVVPSVFLHLSTAGNTLHMHCDNHVMGPVKREYHAVDRLPAQLDDEHRRLLRATALNSLPAKMLSAPFNALADARSDGRRGKRLLRDLLAVRQDPAFDYGARLSVREIAAGRDYHNYFQVVDGAQVVSAVECHVLAAVRVFLDAHGVDTADFRSFQQTIFNHGVIQQGGVSVVGNQAVGQGATAVGPIPRPL